MTVSRPAIRLQAAADGPRHRKLYRTTGGRALGGVAAGLGEHLGLSPTVIRLAFGALALVGGLGVAMYAAFWVFVPQREGAAEMRAEQRGQLLAVAALGVGGLLLLQQLGLPIGSPTWLPLLAVIAGVALVWRQADVAQRARWRATASGPRGLARAIGGAVLLAAGLAGFLATRGQLGAARQGLASTVVVVLGIGVLTGPFWLRMTADLRAERRERIRSQERAEVAAHVHDSVLQTLALIQKASDDPREVTRLARGQERELRGWLYRPAGDAEGAFGAALERAAAEVEETHRTPVEVIVVGDCPADARLGALVAAAREAMVNAAKHSGADQVQVYAEVEPAQVTVFVRDRGAGFDPEAVPADRYGLAQSVVGRMERNGGKAVVRSAPGEGTEVQLEVPRG
ncbi:MAG: putative two-component system sensor kinase [Frankiales bacterium]|nr:putative two-component system sensor kinase [Frankiales bacterium]